MAVFDCHTVVEGYPLGGVANTLEQLQAVLREAGVDQALVASRRAMCADPVAGNRILNAMLEKADGLYGCVVAHLNRVEESVLAIRDLLGSRRFLAVALQAAHPGDPLPVLVADEVLTACRRFQKPILVPATDARGVEVALQLAKQYSMHRFVFVGMGGADWRSAIAAAHQSVNITLETSGPMDRAKIPAAIATLGSHRILFGSGAPDCDPAAALGLLTDSEISEADMRRIVHDNAARLFNLGGASE